MTAAHAFAPAKINLTLHVTGQRDDGYHLLDSLVVFADVGDRLWLEPAPDMSLDVTGPFAKGVPTDGRNLVWKAAEAAGTPLRIRLEKNLPHGGGIGGGSADAAAVLRHLGAGQVAATLGADVPVCLDDRAKRMTGIGDCLTPVPRLGTWDIVLVNPGVEVPTPSVFKALCTKTNAPMGTIPSQASKDDFIRWLAQQRNDLQEPAISLAPEIADALNILKGAKLVRMSGSGSTCFGLYRSAEDAQAAQDRIASAHPNWWVKAAKTL